MQEKTFINQQLGTKFNSYIDEKCRVWFKAKEVAQILGYKKTEDAIKRHVSENNKRTFLFCCPCETRGQQNDTRGKYCLFVDEAGFYIDQDCLLQNFFVSGFFPKYSHQFVNMAILKCLNPN